MKSEVYFIKGFDKKSEEKFLKTLKSEISRVFKPNETIAIKMHMGDKGNYNNIQPEFVSKIIQVFKELKINCFIFDSPTAYKRLRHTEEDYLKFAESRGFTKISKVIISNKGIKKKGKYQDYEICEPLIKADGVLVLSHVKGHECSGFGASIKNLGMGALTKKSKGNIHSGGKPIFDPKKCAECKTCEKVCPTKNISCEKGKPEFGKTECFGCSICVFNCPQKAIKPKLELFDKLLADGGITAAKSFKKYYCINVLRKIVKFCDCCEDGGPEIAKDLGILLSKDIIAIDKAALDLITKNEGKNVFEEVHHKSPMIHIQEAHDLCGGSLEYDFKEGIPNQGKLLEKTRDFVKEKNIKEGDVEETIKKARKKR